MQRRKLMYNLKCALLTVVTLFFTAVPITPAFAAESGCVENVCRDVAELKDTHWKLVELGGTPVALVPLQKHAARIILTGEGSRLSAFGGCNQLAGGYIQEGNALRFTPIAGTKMACESPNMELEERFLKMLGTTTHYRIEDQRLILLGGDQAMARFEAMHE
jgi:putative lipoprotein